MALAGVFGNTFGVSTWVTATLLSSASWGQAPVVSWHQASCGLFLVAALMASDLATGG